MIPLEISSFFLIKELFIIGNRESAKQIMIVFCRKIKGIKMFRQTFFKQSDNIRNKLRTNDLSFVRKFNCGVNGIIIAYT